MDPIYFLISELLSGVMEISPAPASSVSRHIFCSNWSEYCLLDHLPAPQPAGPGAVARAKAGPRTGPVLGGGAGAGAWVMTPELVGVQGDWHHEEDSRPGTRAEWCEGT